MAAVVVDTEEIDWDGDFVGVGQGVGGEPGFFAQVVEDVGGVAAGKEGVQKQPVVQTVDPSGSVDVVLRVAGGLDGIKVEGDAHCRVGAAVSNIVDGAAVAE